ELNVSLLLAAKTPLLLYWTCLSEPAGLTVPPTFVQPVPFLHCCSTKVTELYRIAPVSVPVQRPDASPLRGGGDNGKITGTERRPFNRKASLFVLPEPISLQPVPGQHRPLP